MNEGLMSVVTPVYPPNAQFLEEAYASLASQVLPDGWAWEWLVQIDGEDHGAIQVPADPRVKVARGRHAGAAVARNLALARSAGGLIKSLDADDILTPGCLGRDIRVLADNLNVGWTASKVIDLLSDGSRIEWAGDSPEPGIVPIGSVFEYWRTHDYRPPVVPGSICMRRELIIGLGGWMALPASEDTGLLVAANMVSPGFYIPEVGLLYRKWSSQSTAQPAHVNDEERRARFAVIEARAKALQALGFNQGDAP